MSNLSTTKQTTGQMTQQASAENSWLTDGGGRESSLSMVSDYTLSYGTDALEAERLVHNADGRFVPAYVALDRKVLRFHAFFRDPCGAPGFKVRKATILHYLEDGSTRVSEKRVENSGIRHRRNLSPPPCPQEGRGLLLSRGLRRRKRHRGIRACLHYSRHG